MARKRKRSKEEDVEKPSSKRSKPGISDTGHAPLAIDHPVLRRYYHYALTLRQYVLSKLPPSSKRRRRKVKDAAGIVQASQFCDAHLNAILDSVIVCIRDPGSTESHRQNIENEIASFSQLAESTCGSLAQHPSGCFSQAEIVDFVIWLLFNRVYPCAHKPAHILCHGYQRASAPGENGVLLSAAAGIPGLVNQYPNMNVDVVKSQPWSNLLKYLGKDGDKFMVNLLLDCGLFVPVYTGENNLRQISGTPLADLPVLNPHPQRDNAPGLGMPSANAHNPSTSSQIEAQDTASKLSDIRLVRHRMLYARPALNAKGEVTFGLRHIHVLNRYPDFSSLEQTIHVMKYIFPRQFGLHNAFTSKVDPRETTQSFKDYTLREREIAKAIYQQETNTRGRVQLSKKLPRRLRGSLPKLVQQLQKFHKHCAYKELLQYYCPKTIDPPSRRIVVPPTLSLPSNVDGTATSGGTTQGKDNLTTDWSEPCFTDYATPAALVSAFCRAVFSRVVPKEFWGDSNTMKYNQRIVLWNVDKFVRARKFESLSLQDILQHMKVKGVPWLCIPNQGDDSRMARTDFHKRQQLLQEFVYYLFDSFLIPLVRSNFHVTESNVHKNRLFYFRHDIWRKLSEPSISRLKLSTFEDLKPEKAVKILGKRSLGFSLVRLLPKQIGARPIMNLRRRIQATRNGVTMLKRSINSIMTPMFNVLNYEKARQKEKLGSSLFSVGDMFQRLRSFRSHLANHNEQGQQLYFAKVDVQSCFDRIPQGKLMEIIEQLLSLDAYRISRHAEVKASKTFGYKMCDISTKPSRRFPATATAAGQFLTFDQMIDKEHAKTKVNTIFIDGVVQQTENRGRLLDLLKDHVENNIVRIGKKFYRQKEGIPQGSVLSSLLCNFFYAAFEEECLGFLSTSSESMLLRLIDDFLLVTLDQSQAERFLQIMHDGDPAYGVTVNAEKSLVNFEIVVNGLRIPRVADNARFPYCGNLVDVSTLDISKDKRNHASQGMSDSLTVEASKIPGQTFYRKSLNTLKIQLHAMFLDTSFNSIKTVLSNIYQAFLESARKCYGYLKCLPAKKRPHVRLLIKTVDDLMALAVSMMQSKRRKGTSSQYQCAVTSAQTIWLASKAFQTVFQAKQTNHGVLLAWLQLNMDRCERACYAQHQILQQAVELGSRSTLSLGRV